jgi:ribosomal protein S18 acetylase RimI-like enzyme
MNYYKSNEIANKLYRHYGFKEVKNDNKDCPVIYMKMNVK